MITAGFPRQAAFVASIASACCDQMYGGSSATSSEVVAREAGVGRHVPELAARPDPHQRQPDVSDQAARVGDHQVPVRPEDAHELRQRRPEVGHGSARLRSRRDPRSRREAARRAGLPRGTRPRAPCRGRTQASRARCPTPVTSWPSETRYAVWRPVSQAVSSATPTGGCGGSRERPAVRCRGGGSPARRRTAPTGRSLRACGGPRLDAVAQPPGRIQ